MRRQREERQQEIKAVASILMLIVLTAECWRTLMWALAVSAW